MKQKLTGEYVQVGSVSWQPFPGEFSTGGIKWKLLHVSPEMGAWTAIFDCKACSCWPGGVSVD